MALAEIDLNARRPLQPGEREALLAESALVKDMERGVIWVAQETQSDGPDRYADTPADYVTTASLIDAVEPTIEAQLAAAQRPLRRVSGDLSDDEQTALHNARRRRDWFHHFKAGTPLTEIEANTPTPPKESTDTKSKNKYLLKGISKKRAPLETSLMAPPQVPGEMPPHLMSHPQTPATEVTSKSWKDLPVVRLVFGKKKKNR